MSSTEGLLGDTLLAYRRDLDVRIEELALLRRCVAQLASPAGEDYEPLIDMVDQSISRGSETSGVLLQWLQSRDEDRTLAQPEAVGHPE